MKYIDDYSGWGNEVLYRMCNEKPLHDDIDIIGSKLWIIGRAYSAAIERKAGAYFKIEEAAKIIKDSDIDSHIDKIRKISRPDKNNITTILEAHKYFTEILKKATNLEKRSLASKYLHFHSPKSVFIYDSIANKKIRLLLKNKKQRFNITKFYDNEYESFCYRCIYYRDNILKNEISHFASPRKIDMELLKYGPLTI